MSGFNTKTPMMDWSPWMRRDFSAENRGGALADAFKIVGEIADGYGETNDKNLLAGLANETDTSKIPTQDFYSQANALKAKNIIDQNKDRVFKDDQQKRANELEAREDANYHLGVFNKEAMGDALKMDKPTFDAKYANAGGLDWAMMYDTQNKKEDRKLSLEDRNRKIEIDNLNLQNTRNSMARANEEYNYNKQQREQNDNDNKFLNAYYSGSLNDELLSQYKDKVSPKVFGTVINEKSSSDILNKYKTWDEFKNSEDYSNPKYNYTVKKTIYDSFGKGEKSASLTDQIKMEEINNNKKDLGRVQEEYKKTYGVDMPISEQSKFIYKGELPEKLKPVDKKPLPAKEAGEYQALSKYESVLNELEKAYNPSYVGGLDSSLNTVSPNFVLTDGHRKFNNLMNDVLLGKTSALTGTLSDRDMALLQASGLSETLGEKDFLEKLKQTKEQVQQMKSKNYDVLNSQYDIPDTFIPKNNESKSDNSQPVITSIRKNNTINTDNNKTVILTGTTPDGKKVLKYSDGSIGYAD